MNNNNLIERVDFSISSAKEYGLNEAIALSFLVKIGFDFKEAGLTKGKVKSVICEHLSFWSLPQASIIVDSLESKGVFGFEKKDSGWKPDKKTSNILVKSGFSVEFYTSLLPLFNNDPDYSKIPLKRKHIAFLNFVKFNKSLKKKWDDRANTEAGNNSKETPSENQKPTAPPLSEPVSKKEGASKPFKAERIQSKAATISKNWQPSEQTLSKLSELGVDVNYAKTLVPEFFTYWSSVGVEHRSWDSKFISHAQRNWQRDAEAFKNPPTLIPINWSPPRSLINALNDNGVDSDFIHDCIISFVMYWQEKRVAHTSWNWLFLNRVREEWERKKKKDATDNYVSWSASLERLNDTSWF